MEETQASDVIVTFIVTPLIMIIAMYLLSCIIAPLVHLNNQTFRIIFTIAGGTPTLFVYQKNKIKKTATTQKHD
ncbi:MAG: hypothetical protein PVH73_02890 [Candidatus Bathyarchaeota archaeon]